MLAGTGTRFCLFFGRRGETDGGNTTDTNPFELLQQVRRRRFITTQVDAYEHAHNSTE